MLIMKTRCGDTIIYRVRKFENFEKHIEILANVTAMTCSQTDNAVRKAIKEISYLCC